MNGVRHFSDTSVEELISTPLEKIFKNSKSILTSSGREDVDVRCLGNGRPFIIEVQRPRVLVTQEVLSAEVEEFNKNCKDVKINNICLVGRDATKLLLDVSDFRTSKFDCLGRNGENKVISGLLLRST